MRGAEGVVDVDVGQLAQLGSERLDLLGFALVLLALRVL